MVAGNQAQLLVDQKAALPQITQVIDNAKHTLDASMFIWEPSGDGKVIADHLIAKAKQGVSVNVTVDQVGSMQIPGTAHYRLFKRMEDNGVHVIRSDRVTRAGVEPIDHRKLIVADGQHMVTGGMNLSSRFANWHDAMVRLDGPVAAQGAAEAIQRWQQLGGTVDAQHRAVLAARPHEPLKNATTSAEILTNDPGRDLDATHYLLDHIDGARKRVWIETPFLSDPTFANALSAAAKRGVDVRIALNGKNSWSFTKALQTFGRSFYPKLAGAGVKIFEQPVMSHAKVALFDNATSVGSTNLMQRSRDKDIELNAEMQGGSIVGEVANMFTTDFARSHQVTPAQANSRLNRALAFIQRKTHLKY